MIELSNVAKSYGSVVALDAVSLRIEPGERVAIVGTNGSGKTTLLRALVGLVRVKGRVTIHGTDVCAAPEVALRGVAYMPQVAPPLEAPVGEVLLAWSTLRGRDVSTVHARGAQLGIDLPALSRTRFRDLSGGMKQKVLAAMALAAEAPALVCDEPTANLDATSRAAFFAQVNDRPSSSALILCSHRIGEVRHLVDRVIELREGRVVRDGPLSALLSELRSFRVEVAVRAECDGAAAATAFLVAHAFDPAGGHRFAALFTQGEKLDIVGRLLRDHEPALLDLCVFDADDVAISSPRKPHGLRAA